MASHFWAESSRLRKTDPLYHYHVMAQRRIIIVGLQGAAVQDSIFEPSIVSAFKRAIPNDYNTAPQSEFFRLLQFLKLNVIVYEWKALHKDHGNQLNFEDLHDVIRKQLPTSSPYTPDQRDDRPDIERFFKGEFLQNEILANLLHEELEAIESKGPRSRHLALEKFVEKYPDQKFLDDLDHFLDNLSIYLPQPALDRIAVFMTSKDGANPLDLSFETVVPISQRPKPIQSARGIFPDQELRRARPPPKASPVLPSSRSETSARKRPLSPVLSSTYSGTSSVSSLFSSIPPPTTHSIRLTPFFSLSSPRQ
jgi:hypothetical protein